MKPFFEMKKFSESFIYSAAVILFVSAGAKLLSTDGDARVLAIPDPLLYYLSRRHVFYLTGTLELGLSAYLLMAQKLTIRLTLIAVLAINFLAYRLGLWWMGSANYCNCLGNLSDRLPISPRLINLAAFAALSWLVTGSTLLLLVEWFRSRKFAASKSQSDLLVPDKSPV